MPSDATEGGNDRLARTNCLRSRGALIWTCPAAAQNYPSQQIELVVPFVAGGTTDNIARLIAQRFSDSWGQTVVVNNRPGGGSTIGTNMVAKAAPDGHTLLVTTIGFAINAGLQKLPYDPIKDFTPITELASIPLMLVVHASLPVTNLQEFIALRQVEAGGWDYATSGPGTSPHLAAEMFKSMAGVDLVHVPFKGNAEVMNALLGGHVKVYFALVAGDPAARQGRHAARARGHHREAPARSARRADHRRTRLSRLRDQLLAGRVRAGRHAEGHRRQDQRRDRAHAQHAGGACAHLAEGADPVGSTPEAVRRARQERNRQMGEGDQGMPACRPRIELTARFAAGGRSPTAFRPAPRWRLRKPSASPRSSPAPRDSISSAPADGASACTIRLGNASRPISVA